MNPQDLLTGARRRVWRNAVCLGAPPVAALAWLAERNVPVAAVAVGLGIPAIAAFALRQARRYDRRWLARTLNAHCPALEDSAELWLLPPATLNALQILQRERLLSRVASLEAPALGPALPRLGLASSCLLAALLLLPPFLTMPGSAGERAAATDAWSASLRVRPPAYTGLGEHRQDALDARVPAGSRIEWSLRSAAEPLALAFVDGERLPLERRGREWRGARVIDTSALYRLEADGQLLASLGPFRLEAVPDAAPVVSVQAPEQTLSLAQPGQARWTLQFEARDDYALGAAELNLTLARGGGENVEVSEHTVGLDGRGDRQQRRYTHDVDLLALGYAEGDDLIARLSVADGREPQANIGRSPSLILRWPPPPFEASAGMDGLVPESLPAIFRSQRQIIIDSEALAARRGALGVDDFLNRADALGADQKILRLRYGQFLGEEFESGRGHEQEHGAGGHPEAPGAFGEIDELAQAFGHSHDNGEAATLFDPTTRRILRSALDEMWLAELQLRIGEPERALPYEHKALDYIQQLRQANRIYLARLGAELPRIDASRRLSGELGNLEAPPPPPPRVDSGSPALDAWNALNRGDSNQLDALQAWAETQPEGLALRAAIDRLRRQPQCLPCREALRQQLWPLMPTPAAGVQRRTEP